MISFIITAPLHCLNAHIIITSGASSASTIKKIRLFRIIQLVSSRPGTFGCTETHVTANVAATQLQRISHTVRPVPTSVVSSRVKTGTSWTDGRGSTMGAALVPYRRDINTSKKTMSMGRRNDDQIFLEVAGGAYVTGEGGQAGCKGYVCLRSRNMRRVLVDRRV